MKKNSFKNKNFRGKQNKTIMMLVSLALIFGITVGGTLAYLIAVDGPVKNTFTPSTVTTSVEEELNGNVKSNVKIKNTGDTTAYIRAAVIVTWQDAAGNVYGQVPQVGTDYAITYNTKARDAEQGVDQWILAEDGFYYWTSPVKSDDEDASNCTTGVLITFCEPVANKAPSGYALTVEIIGSGIQSLPTSVVTKVWSSGVSGVKAVEVDENKTISILNIKEKAISEGGQ